MNTKIKYTLPVLVVAISLMFVVAIPYVIASSDGENTWKGTKHFKHRALQVDGFVGSIPVTEGSDKKALKEKVTVSLSEASQGLDVQGGHIGIVTNENGERFLAWSLVSMDKDSERMSMTIHIVDAGNAENTVQITKHLDHSWKIKHQDDSEK
ncbi:MAG: hypothetical protein QXE84_04940 [Candidatus Nitrosotenuis sp.]